MYFINDPTFDNIFSDQVYTLYFYVNHLVYNFLGENNMVINIFLLNHLNIITLQ